MKAPEALLNLADITASQWGLITARQAQDAGLSYLDLSRLTHSGQLNRLEQGIYRHAGAPADDLESLRAAWLSTDPARLAGERLSDRESGVVISGKSAATVHRIGDLREGAHEFTVPTRRQSKRTDIRYRKRLLPEGAVVIREGLPVTSAEQTVLDLLDEGEDLSLVAQVLRDASNDELDQDAIRHGLNMRIAHRYGQDDQTALWNSLQRIAGIDEDSLADELAAGFIGPRVTAKYLRELSEALTVYGGEEARKAIQGMDLSDISDAIMESIRDDASRSRELITTAVRESIQSRASELATSHSHALRTQLANVIIEYAHRHRHTSDGPAKERFDEG